MSQNGYYVPYDFETGSGGYWAKTIIQADIGNTVTSIGEYAFGGGSGLTSVTMPNSVTSIGIEAFVDCSSLISVTIPDKVTSIGYDAFTRCSGLTSMTIPTSVTSIGWHAFAECIGLTNVTFFGKTLEQVQNIEDGEGNKEYPWGIEDTSIITVA